MRERLIELLNDCWGIEGSGEELRKKFADYLLENGVIVPPCKVGDTLYDITEFLAGEEHPEMYVLYADEITVEKNGWFVVDSCSLRFEDFGKTVFLTREEAEQALKEREKT